MQECSVQVNNLRRVCRDHVRPGPRGLVNGTGGLNPLGRHRLRLGHHLDIHADIFTHVYGRLNADLETFDSTVYSILYDYGYAFVRAACTIQHYFSVMLAHALGKWCET